MIGLAVLIGSLSGINEIFLLFGAGMFALAVHEIKNKNTETLRNFTPLTFLYTSSDVLWTATNAKLFWIFLKIGSVLYGSGYVLFAFLDTELVETGLLIRAQLMDAIAVGQLTPGPIFSSVTFVGYQVNGISGAIISTMIGAQSP